jgi:Carboxypeptidase regulatory-like domain/TonB dependent receptor
VIVLLFATAALPQGAPTGGITGVVKDSQGGVLPDAQVEIYNEQTGRLERSLKTESDGSYTVTLLSPGTYRVEVTVSSFKKYRGVSVPVRIGEISRHDATLTLGTVSETVVVEATPTVVNTVSATTGQPVDPHTLTTLPLASPNFLFLLTLSPGANSEPVDVRSAGRGNVDIVVNGQRTSNNSVALEGVNVNDFNLAHFDNLPIPAPSAIEEFKVATSLYDASQGSKGGGAVALVLKSGTKQLHGGANWQHRNDALNANEWFRNATASTLHKNARLLQNVFGADASGPALGIGGFWFFNYQGVRARNGIDTNGSTLNPLVQNFPTNADGTTSANLLAGAFGLTPSQIDPVAVNILNQKLSTFGGTYLVPRSGQAGCNAAKGATATFRCTFSAIAPITGNQYVASYDRPFRQDKDKISGRFFYDDGSVNRPFGTASSLAFPQSVVLHNRFASLAWTHLISSRQTNEARVGFNRFFQPNVPDDLVSLSDIGATRPNISSVPGMYRISLTGLFSIGTGVNDDRTTVSNTFYYADTWSLTAGKHTLRAGGELSRYQLNRSNRFSIRGSLTFDPTTGSFSAFQNFLQGRITALQSGAGDPQRYFRDTDYAFFFQDDFRIRPRFTLNMGLRWDLLGFGHDLFFRSAIYDPTLLLRQPPVNPFLFAQSLNVGGFTGTPGVSDCTLQDCRAKSNLGPRLGFAWDVTGNQRSVVRGGFAIYYQRLSNQNLLQGSLTAPFFVQLIDQRATPPSFQLQNPLANQPASTGIATAFIPQISYFSGLRCVASSCTTPLGASDPNVAPIFVNQDGQKCSGFGGTATNCTINLASFATATPDTHAPYVEQWNLSIQRDFGHSWALELAYVGTHGVGGLGISDPYLARLASPASPITVTTNAPGVTPQTFTITTNTANNEPLRNGVLGLSRTKGARFLGNIGQSIYHSGQATLSHRFQGGLFFQAAYTFSKVIDNVSGAQSTDELNATRNGQGGANILNDQSNPAQNRAIGDFDRPHRFIVSYAWDIPAPKSGIWGTQIFRGWTLSGIVTYQSGLPFSPTDGSSGRAFGTSVGTGMLICNAKQDTSLPTCTPGTPTTVQQVSTINGSIQNNLNHFLNPNFVSPSQNVPNAAGLAGSATGFGNIPRNAFRGPFQQNWDFSVAKTFSFLERHQFRFRADFFNLFNHPVFRLPSLNTNAVDVGTPDTFGQITETALPARLIQFGLRYSF